MPLDTIIVLSLIVSAFLLIAGVLMWGDYQTRRPSDQPEAGE